MHTTRSREYIYYVVKVEGCPADGALILSTLNDSAR